MCSQNWVAISVIISFHTLDRHNASSGSSDIRRSTKWSKLHTSLVIDLAMVDIRTVHLVTFVVETHDSILLVSNLLFCKIRAIFAFISRHFEVLATTLGSILIVKWRYIGTTIVILIYLVIHTSTLSVSALFSETISFSLLTLVTLWVHAVAIVVSIRVACHWLIRIRIMIGVSSRSWKQYFLVFKLLIDKVFVSSHT